MSKLLDETRIGPEYSRGLDDHVRPQNVSLVRALHALEATFPGPSFKEMVQSIADAAQKISQPASDQDFREGLTKMGFKASAMPTVTGLCPRLRRAGLWVRPRAVPGTVCAGPQSTRLKGNCRWSLESASQIGSQIELIIAPREGGGGFCAR